VFDWDPAAPMAGGAGGHGGHNSYRSKGGRQHLGPRGTDSRLSP